MRACISSLSLADRQVDDKRESFEILKLNSIVWRPMIEPMRMLSKVVVFAAAVLLCFLNVTNPASAHGGHSYSRAVSSAPSTVKLQNDRSVQIMACLATGAEVRSAPTSIEASSNGNLDCLHAGGFSSCCGAACHGGIAAAVWLNLDMPDGVSARRGRSLYLLRQKVVFGLKRPPKI